MIFVESMETFNPKDTSCPFCYAKHPNWQYHASYNRYLVDIYNGNIHYDTITITRMRCDSCNHTHAILPECLLPYGSYSLIFVLNVLQHYFLKQKTVKNICEHFQISHSTLYAWIKLFSIHKKLWLGFLDDFIISSLDFLNEFFSTDPSKSKLSQLLHFHAYFNYSFLQGVSINARFNSS